MRHVVLILTLTVGALACSSTVDRASPRKDRGGGASAAGTCHFPSEPTVVRAEGNAVLLFWEVEERALWSSSQLPSDAAYTRYRSRIEEIGADQMRPEQYVPEDQRGQENWRRELHNVEQAYSTGVGVLRPIRCLDALLFATQNARVRQLEAPTEFLASVLRKTVGDRTLLRVYFGAGDELFPPKIVYGFDQVERDVAAGWEYVAMLHNHTLQDVEGQMRLGVPAPSVSDVQLLNGLIERYGLEEAWVTNGVYTVEIRTGDMGRYLGPE